MNPDTQTFAEYLEHYPKNVQALLKKMRATIRKAAPQATELIAYGMPAYRLEGVLVYFAGYERHIGFYPGAAGIAAFKKEISKYKSAKGSVQFSHDQPLPLALVSRITKFRAKENLAKAAQKKSLKKRKSA